MTTPIIDSKTEEITELLNIINGALKKIPGYDFSFICVKFDDKVGHMGKCSVHDLKLVMDSILGNLEPEIVTTYLVSRLKSMLRLHSELVSIQDDIYDKEKLI